MFLYEISFIPIPTYIYIYIYILFTNFSKEINMSPRTRFPVTFSRKDIVPFGMAHPLYLPQRRIIAKVRKRKVVHASKTRLTRAGVRSSESQESAVYQPRNSGLSRKRNDSPGDYWLFFAGFTAGRGGDADKVRRGANTRAKVTQFRDQETWRADASTRGGYGRGSGSMDDGHQGGH